MEAVLDSPLRCREAEDPGIQLGEEKRYFKANGCALQKVSLIKAKWKREALRRETEKHPNTWQGNLSMPFPGKSCFLQHLLFPRGAMLGSREAFSGEVTTLHRGQPEHKPEECCFCGYMM